MRLKKRLFAQNYTLSFLANLTVIVDYSAGPLTLNNGTNGVANAQLLAVNTSDPRAASPAVFSLSPALFGYYISTIASDAASTVLFWGTLFDEPFVRMYDEIVLGVSMPSFSRIYAMEKAFYVMMFDSYTDDRLFKHNAPKPGMEAAADPVTGQVYYGPGGLLDPGLQTLKFTPHA